MKLRLDTIENEALSGVSGIKDALSFLRTYSSKREDLSGLVSSADTLFRSISTRTLNMIATNETYKKQIMDWRKKHGHVTNTKSLVAGLISHVEDEMNKDIITAKRSDTKHKRQLEKKIVMSFYQTNKDELKKIFDLQNLLVQAKDMVKL